ncbi:DUF996 domain-containing protein [Thermococcus sp. MV11]|uniref:DUF996 domain-containing protein n=1 Tax=Thermococcus sp. MV11 TaxID=1638267 RepID=UPI001F10717F|nr:DUF996 domain-containing protein [Thermococcus sp. MV11]
MASLKTARTWGGFGAVLSMFYFTYFLGFIMKLFAVKEISAYLKKEQVMKDYLWAAMLNIIGNLVMLGAFYSAWDQMQDVIGNPEEINAIFRSLNWWFFLGALIMLIGVWFLRRSYDTIASETGVKTFSTAGLLYLWGTVFIFFFIGYLLIVAAAVLEAMAFFGLPEELPEGSGEAQSDTSAQ